MLFAGHRLPGGNSEYHSHKTEQILHSKVIEWDVWQLINVIKSDMRLNWIKSRTFTHLQRTKVCALQNDAESWELLMVRKIQKNGALLSRCDKTVKVSFRDHISGPTWKSKSISRILATQSRWNQKWCRKIFYTAMLIKRAHPAFQELL